MLNLKLIQSDLLQQYLEQVNDLQPKFEALKDADISTDTFSFIHRFLLWQVVKLKVSKWK